MNYSKKALIAAAVTGVFPVAAQAQLGVNLVENPSFELVSGTTAQLWGGNVSTYAYSQNYTAAGPAGAGDRYWFGGGGDPLATQSISIGLLAGLIDAGQAQYNLSAFFSSYHDQRDYSTVRAVFLDAGNNAIGSLAAIGGDAFVNAIPSVGGGDLNRFWAQDSLSGFIPAGTRSVRIELDGDKQAGVGSVCDGYVDSVNFQIVPEPSTWALLGLGGLGLLCWRRRR